MTRRRPLGRPRVGKILAASRAAGRVWLVAVSIGLAGSSVQAQIAAATDGASLYTAYGCYQCHGYQGQGGVAGPRIAPSPYPYPAFAQLVRRPANVMPAYAAGVLSDETLRAIFDYVRGVEEPAALEDIPALR